MNKIAMSVLCLVLLQSSTILAEPTSDDRVDFSYGSNTDSRVEDTSDEDTDSCEFVNADGPKAGVLMVKLLDAKYEGKNVTARLTLITNYGGIQNATSTEGKVLGNNGRWHSAGAVFYWDQFDTHNYDIGQKARLWLVLNTAWIPAADQDFTTEVSPEKSDGQTWKFWVVGEENKTFIRIKLRYRWIGFDDCPGAV